MAQRRSERHTASNEAPQNAAMLKESSMMMTSRFARPAGLVLALIALVGAVVIGGARFVGGGEGATAAETDATRTLSVSGEGRVSLAPDIVMMTLGVDIRNEDLSAAQNEAESTMQAVLDALRAAGVAEEDLQTSGYSINVERDWNQPTQPIIGYLVSHTVTAKVRDIDGAGAVLAAGVDAGANNVSGVWFALDDSAAAVQQARERAVADAEARAQELARLSNSTLGPVQHIAEGVNGYMPAARNSGGGVAYDAESAASVSIQPGQTEVVITVNVTYAIN